MNTPCKILAMAWMAIHPFSANVHADNINWEEVSHFFNFNTIEAEKRTNLETNIRLLVEEQFKLPSGQNLWKAFQFWEDQHPELGFQFEFALIDESEAYIKLKNYENQIFLFEIALNKVFAEDFKIPFWQVIKNNLHQKTNLGLKKLLNENMLYRPCLIKLVDPNDSSHWEYHLREQKLPFFITLAHEFLHILNQLECIDWLMERNEDFSNPKSRLQEFLIQKLKLQDNAGILKKQYKKLWKNKGFDDSLDEMTVILGKKRQTEDFLSSFIGESTFLQEYYKDDSIISWSHYSFYSYVILENMEILLEKTYTKKVLKVFKNLKIKSQNFDYSNVRKHHSSCWPELYLQKHEEYFSNWFLQTVKKYQYQNDNVKMSINFKNWGTFEFIISPNQVILFGKKDIATYAANCSWGSFSVIDNQKLKSDCVNSIYTAMDQYLKPNVFAENTSHSQVTNSMLPPPPSQYGIWKKPSMKVYDGTSDLKFWDNGLNGVCGFEKLKDITIKIEKDFLIIFRKPNGRLKYLKINSKNFETQAVDEFDIENLFNDNVNAIKIYYNGVYCQPIIKVNK